MTAQENSASITKVHRTEDRNGDTTYSGRQVVKRNPIGLPSELFAQKPHEERPAAIKDRILLTRRSRAYWRVSFNRSSISPFGVEMIPQLNEIITAIETDEKLKVVVFDCGVEGLLQTHFSLFAALEGATQLQKLPDMIARLSCAPVISIASIRGRAIGVGSALALASDMRFASREKAIFSPWKLGAGQMPGYRPMVRLQSLTGCGRALEILLGADDIEGDLAERYGYVNRSLPDSQLDGFVEDLATRIVSLNKHTIAESKCLTIFDERPAVNEIWPMCETVTVSEGGSSKKCPICETFHEE